jgi:hypothetical protein
MTMVGTPVAYFEWMRALALLILLLVSVSVRAEDPVTVATAKPLTGHIYMDEAAASGDLNNSSSAGIGALQGDDYVPEGFAPATPFPDDIDDYGLQTCLKTCTDALCKGRCATLSPGAPAPGTVARNPLTR